MSRNNNPDRFLKPVRYKTEQNMQKYYVILCIILLFSCSSTQLKETKQEQIEEDSVVTIPVQIYETDSNLILASKTQCELSEITSFFRIGNTITVQSNFSGVGLESCCWTPEVIVQYIFDCSLYPLAKYVFANNKFDKVNEIILTVKSDTKKKPQEIVFTFSRDECKQLQEGKSIQSKIQTYENLRVNADGQRLYFDAKKAVDVE